MVNNLKELPQGDLATRIRTARKAASLSQTDIANFIGLSDKSISAYEKGRSVPSISKLKQIAQVTNLPISYFTNADITHETLDTIIHSIEQELQEIKKLLKLK